MPQPEDKIQWIIKKCFPRSFGIKRRAMHAWKFGTAKYVVVSFPKSGRTWLRATLTFYYAERYGLADPPLLEFANLHYLDRRIPKIYFTHDEEATLRPDELGRDKSHYRHKHVLFVSRDPRDVCVSLYFHRRHRDRDIEQPIFEFATGEAGGLRTTIEFMNIWRAALKQIPASLEISYEAMHAESEQTLAKILRFFGEEPDPRAIRIAIERARFDRLQSLERKGAFTSGRLIAADPSDADSFKVRRGKVGGFADYFDAEQQKRLDELVRNHASAGAFGVASSSASGGATGGAARPDA
ncbi:MAG: sulfotransferase domain-containing protein [Myxococcota bacterium]